MQAANGTRDNWRDCAIPGSRPTRRPSPSLYKATGGEEHIFELTQALELYRFYQDKIAECDREIAAQLERFEDRSDGEPPAPNGKKRNQKNAPRFDAQGQLYRMTGVDLTRIDGVDAYTALKVVSEIGTDMTKWPSAKHFASWLGLSPNNRITGGRVMSSKTKPSANRAAAALRLAANALHRSDSALGAFLRRKKRPPGSAQGHHRHGPQAGQAHLHHAAVRPGIRGCRRGILRETVSARGRCVRPSAGRHNWATSWCPSPPMRNLRTCPTDQRPRPRDSFG